MTARDLQPIAEDMETTLGQLTDLDERLRRLARELAPHQLPRLMAEPETSDTE